MKNTLDNILRLGQAFHIDVVTEKANVDENFPRFFDYYGTDFRQSVYCECQVICRVCIVPLNTSKYAGLPSRNLWVNFARRDVAKVVDIIFSKNISIYTLLDTTYYWCVSLDNLGSSFAQGRGLLPENWSSSSRKSCHFASRKSSISFTFMGSASR